MPARGHGEDVFPFGSCRCFAADISRTFPASGKFTASQKDLYNGVLKVQVSHVASRQLNQYLSINNRICLSGLVVIRNAY